MGTVLSSTVVIVSGSISTNTYRDTQWLTLGITVSSSSSGTCTTSTAMVLWTKTILNAWLFVTPSSRVRVTGKRLPSKRTRRSWQTCGTKLLSWLTSIRTVKLTQKNSLPLSKKTCTNKPFAYMPAAFKAFIDQHFRSIDVDGDGSVGLTEFRVDCVNRMAYKNIADLDAAYNKLLNDEDKKVGGITLARYQELYAQFIGNPDESCPAVNLFGPLEVIG